MKQTCAFFLMVLFTFCISGNYIAFKFKQAGARKEVRMMIKKNISDDKLIVIVRTEHNKNEFEWEHASEFHYRGMMYDVVKRERNELGEEVFYCLSDKQEKELYRNFEDSQKNSPVSGMTNQSSKTPVKFQISDYLISCQSKINICTSIVNNIVERDVLFSSFISDCFSPPPEPTA